MRTEVTSVSGISVFLQEDKKISNVKEPIRNCRVYNCILRYIGGLLFTQIQLIKRYQIQSTKLCTTRKHSITLTTKVPMPPQNSSTLKSSGSPQFRGVGDVNFFLFRLTKL